jgi:hypothetical protein
MEQFDLTNPIEVIHFYVFCVKLERSLQEKYIPLLQEFVAPTEMEIKGLVWRSADKIKGPGSRKGTASTSISSVSSDSSGGNTGGGSSSHGGGGNDDSNGDGGSSGRNRDGDGDGSSGHNNNDVAAMDETGDNQTDWKMQLMAWKNEAVQSAKEASLISGEGQSLTSRHLRRH